MAAPIIPLQVVQAGIEATRGTLVAATHKVDFKPGTATLKLNAETIRIRQAGSLATSHRSYPGRQWPELDLEPLVTYDYLPLWLNLVLGPLSSGTGTGADKTWAFTGGSIVSDTADNLKSLSMEVGGVDTWPAEFQLPGMVCDQFDLSIKQNEPWALKVHLMGYSFTQAAKTGSLSLLTGVEDILGTQTKVYLDSASAFGTTQLTGDLVSADVSIKQGFAQRFVVNGAGTAYRIAIVKERAVSAKIIVEFDAAGLAALNAFTAKTAQRLRLAATGPTLGLTNYSATVDVAGTWDAAPLANDAGVITVELDLVGQYDSTPAADIVATVVNAAATLP